MNELREILFGELSFAQYMGAMIITTIGYIIWFVVNYVNSSKPSKWSWKIFNEDKNWWYLFLLLICSWVFLRWQEDSLIGINKISGNHLAFIKDKWFWFLIGGVLFRLLIHVLHRFLVKKQAS